MLFHSSHNFLLRIPPFPPKDFLPHPRWILTLKPSYGLSAFTLENVRETTSKIFASFWFVFIKNFSFIIGSVRITNEFGYFVYFSLLPMTQDGPYRSAPCEGSDQEKKNKKTGEAGICVRATQSFPALLVRPYFDFCLSLPSPVYRSTDTSRWLVLVYFFIYFFVFCGW